MNPVMKIKMNPVMKNNDKCCICITNSRTHAFNICGHKCLCIDGANIYTKKNIKICPICRKTGILIKIY